MNEIKESISLLEDNEDNEDKKIDKCSYCSKDKSKFNSKKTM